MNELEKSPRGRPRKYAGKRPTWTIRLEEKYGDQIKKEASDSGRSISEVCERYIVDALTVPATIQALQDRITELTNELIETKAARDRAQSNLADLRQMNISSMERGYQLQRTVEALLDRIDTLTAQVSKYVVERQNGNSP